MPAKKVNTVQDPTLGHGHTGAANDGKLIAVGLNGYNFVDQSGWSIAPNATVTTGPYVVPNNGNQFHVTATVTFTGTGNGGGVQYGFQGSSALPAAYSAGSFTQTTVYNPAGNIKVNLTNLGGTINASATQILVAALDLGK